MQRYLPLVVGCVFLTVCWLLYLSLDASSARRRRVLADARVGDGVEVAVGRLEQKLRRLEDELQRNEALIGDIRGNLDRAVAPPSAQSGAVCDAQSAVAQQASGDIQMLDVYDMLTFDDADGGVWKQGWPITYDSATVAKEAPLNVFVVPHSHCDPGWIKTFEKYFTDQTKHILDQAVRKLSEYADMRFIYAEMSFFERWWRSVDDVQRNAARRILESGQMEIVTGAWVMTDEANAHYFAMIDQLLEGHQWLDSTLGYKPSTHWSIDPFGLSPTMAFLLNRANITCMVIQRVHYAVKKQLARQKQLEFQWRQLWADAADATDQLTHLMPFYSYDVPHTCGPDPKVCCQFDFKRLPGGGVSCPWGVAPVAVDEANVAARATELANQYRLKAQLYAGATLLVPLGDDFRYDTAAEWDNQRNNYRRLFDNINSRADLNMRVQFGTLADYFAALHKDAQRPPLPVLTGDFFTYSDRNDHYWSGYYTSRPFYKRVDRTLQHYLRSAEIAYSFSIGLVRRDKAAGYPFEDLFQYLVAARRDLALFQHHDGITGTAKDLVVVDYGQRMLSAIVGCKRVVAASAEFLLAEKVQAFRAQVDALAFDVDELHEQHDAEPVKILIKVAAAPRAILLYNSLASGRTEVVCLNVDSPLVQLFDAADAPVRIQINPFISKRLEQLEISTTIFELCFEANLPAVGVLRLYLKASASEQPDPSVLARLETNFELTSPVFESKRLEAGGSFQLTTSTCAATFSSDNGLLTAMRPSGGAEQSLRLSFVHYGARGHKPGARHGGDSLSGAYLFLPDGAARPAATDGARVAVVRGPLLSAVVSAFAHVQHRARLLSAGGGALAVSNRVDIGVEQNYELAMRVESAVRSSAVFFTDLNGFQMIKRKRFDKIPLQGNFYPMAAAAYIEDDSSRLSLLTAQPLGVSSLNEGWLEVMLDRRLNQDDDRGLFQGVTDNKLTPDHFYLALETRSKPRQDSQASKAGYNSLLAHQLSQMLLYPPIILFQKQPEAQRALKSAFVGLSEPLPCGWHLVNFRTLQEKHDYSQSTDMRWRPRREHAFILHRPVVECPGDASLSLNCSSQSAFSLTSFAHAQPQSVEECSLTLMYKRADLKAADKIQLKPMDLRTFKLRFA